jgi:cell division protein ZapA (FtsZ GTPase activity inhibitor)
MPPQPVELSVGGHAYRVLTDTDPTKLQRLAAILDDHVRACDPKGKLTATQALLYAALTLAEQLDEERAEASHFEAETRQSLNGILSRIDAAIEPNAAFASTRNAGTETHSVR